MGHIRIGTLPANKKWKEVVGLVTEGADVGKVAESTLYASNLAFKTVQNDFAFREAVWMLTQLGVAGEKGNPARHLSAVGIDIEHAESVVDVAMSLANELDRRVDAQRTRSDFGEMAQRALISAVTEHLQEKMPTLIDSSEEEVFTAVQKIAKKKDFGQLARRFFSKFTNQYLEYFLSKTVPAQVGNADRPFATTAQVREFEEALSTHCEEAAAIVQEFSGDWLSKNRFEGGGDINRETAEKFGWYALDKMRSELAARAKEK